MLGYAALSRKQIEKGIARLSDAIDDAIDDPATDMTAYFSQQSMLLPRCHPARNPSSRIWLPDFGSNRLYAGRHLIVQCRRRSSHDKVARQCPF